MYRLASVYNNVISDRSPETYVTWRIGSVRGDDAVGLLLGDEGRVDGVGGQHNNNEYEDPVCKRNKKVSIIKWLKIYLTFHTIMQPMKNKIYELNEMI